MSKNEWDLIVGRAVSPFGRKGEVKILPYTDKPERLEDLKEACIARETGSRILKVEKVWCHKASIIIKFAGIDDISAAETLRGAEIRVRESDIPPLAENEYYVHDIIGADVVTTEGESLGEVKDILRSPANDVYVTDRAMIPAVKEFVVSIDIRGRKIVVKNVEGLVQE